MRDEPRRDVAGGSDAVVQPRSGGDDGHDRGREVRQVSEKARSRRFLADRLNSSRNYAHFAAAAGEDLFNGEPMERFAAVGKLDERTLRMRAQELREDIFAEAMRNRSLPLAATPQVGG